MSSCKSKESCGRKHNDQPLTDPNQETVQRFDPLHADRETCYKFDFDTFLNSGIFTVFNYWTAKVCIVINDKFADGLHTHTRINPQLRPESPILGDPFVFSVLENHFTK